MARDRFFIIAPQTREPQDEVYHVCRTLSGHPALEAYNNDDYDVIWTATSLEEAKQVAAEQGVEDPEVI